MADGLQNKSRSFRCRSRHRVKPALPGPVHPLPPHHRQGDHLLRIQNQVLSGQENFPGIRIAGHFFRLDMPPIPCSPKVRNTLSATPTSLASTATGPGFPPPELAASASACRGRLLFQRRHFRGGRFTRSKRTKLSFRADTSALRTRPGQHAGRARPPAGGSNNPQSSAQSPGAPGRISRAPLTTSRISLGELTSEFLQHLDDGAQHHRARKGDLHARPWRQREPAMRRG